MAETPQEAVHARSRGPHEAAALVQARHDLDAPALAVELDERPRQESPPGLHEGLPEAFFA